MTKANGRHSHTQEQIVKILQSALWDPGIEATAWTEVMNGLNALTEK